MFVSCFLQAYLVGFLYAQQKKKKKRKDIYIYIKEA